MPHKCTGLYSYKGLSPPFPLEDFDLPGRVNPHIPHCVEIIFLGDLCHILLDRDGRKWLSSSEIIRLRVRYWFQRWPQGLGLHLGVTGKGHVYQRPLAQSQPSSRYQKLPTSFSLKSLAVSIVGQRCLLYGRVLVRDRLNMEVCGRVWRKVIAFINQLSFTLRRIFS